MVSGSFWVVSAGFRWFQMISGGFKWFQVVLCFIWYVSTLSILILLIIIIILMQTWIYGLIFFIFVSQKSNSLLQVLKLILGYVVHHNFKYCWQSFPAFENFHFSQIIFPKYIFKIMSSGDICLSICCNKWIRLNEWDWLIKNKNSIKCFGFS